MAILYTRTITPAEALKLWGDLKRIPINEQVHEKLIKRLDKQPQAATALTIEHIQRAKDWLKR